MFHIIKDQYYKSGNNLTEINTSLLSKDLEHYRVLKS